MLKLIYCVRICITALFFDSLIGANYENITDIPEITSRLSSAPETCSLCKIVSDMFGNNTKLSMPIEKLVHFVCLKANTTSFVSLVLKSPENFTAAAFDYSIPFAVITHGYSDNFPGGRKIMNRGWLEMTTLSWAKNNVNVCAIDWEGLSTSINYFDVINVGVPRVTDAMVDLILFLETQGMNVSETSAAGHSLGAHICGRAGKKLLRLKHKPLKVIYGLDPAGPCFTYPCTVDVNNRVHASDALHVQCIHTNTFLLGQSVSCGCEDFFVSTEFYNPSDSHLFANILFEWTLNVHNKCNDSKFDHLLGIHGPKTCGHFEVKTHRSVPYCKK